MNDSFQSSEEEATESIYIELPELLHMRPADKMTRFFQDIGKDHTPSIPDREAVKRIVSIDVTDFNRSKLEYLEDRLARRDGRIYLEWDAGSYSENLIYGGGAVVQLSEFAHNCMVELTVTFTGPASAVHELMQIFKNNIDEIVEGWFKH